MENLFQVIRQNDDGSIVIEYPVYTTETVAIPTDANGAPLTGANLGFVLNTLVNSRQTSKEPVSQSGADFCAAAGFTSETYASEDPDATVIPEQAFVGAYAG